MSKDKLGFSEQQIDVYNWYATEMDAELRVSLENVLMEVIQDGKVIAMWRKGEERRLLFSDELKTESEIAEIFSEAVDSIKNIFRILPMQLETLFNHMNSEIEKMFES